MTLDKEGEKRRTRSVADSGVKRSPDDSNIVPFIRLDQTFHGLHVSKGRDTGKPPLLLNRSLDLFIDSMQHHHIASLYLPPAPISEATPPVCLRAPRQIRHGERAREQDECQRGRPALGGERSSSQAFSRTEGCLRSTTLHGTPDQEIYVRTPDRGAAAGLCRLAKQAAGRIDFPKRCESMRFL